MHFGPVYNECVFITANCNGFLSHVGDEEGRRVVIGQGKRTGNYFWFVEVLICMVL